MDRRAPDRAIEKLRQLAGESGAAASVTMRNSSSDNASGMVSPSAASGSGLSSHACVMTGVGETLLPLTLPKMPCVLVNPCVPVATADVFKALGLRHGELRVGATDVILHDPVWPEAGAPIDAWIKVLAGIGNDLEKPAMRIQPVIGEVLAALRGTAGARLARMSGSGATCFAIFDDDAATQRAAQTIQLEHPQWWVHAGVLS